MTVDIPAKETDGVIIRYESCCICCTYYAAVYDEVGICRRYPPKVFIIHADGLEHTECFYPEVRINDWCGEYFGEADRLSVGR